MPAATLADPVPTRSRPESVVPVFLPKEHGSWSLALEPVALGLLVAPSWAGGALAGAVLAGFFARRPFKAAGSPVHSARRHAARETLVMWSALAVTGLFEAGVLGGWANLWPLAPLALLGAVFLAFDAQDESRAAAAEAAGCAAFACVPAALATLAGRGAATALVLTALALARSLPTILTVRTCLRLAKGETAGRALPWAVSLLGALVLAALAAAGLAPRVAAGLGLLLPWRAGWLLGPWRPDWPARRLGQAEAALGVLYVILLSVLWPSA